MGVLQKVGDFLGVKKFSDALATTGRVLSGSVSKDIQSEKAAGEALSLLTYAMKNEQNPEKKNQLRQLLQSQINQGIQSATDIDPNINLTPKEIVGSGANVALNVAMPGAFKGKTTAVLAKNAALGAGFGAASGLEKNRDTSGIIGSTVGGAIIGGAVGAAGLGAKTVKKFLTETTPEWIMNKAVKPALQDLKKNVKYGTDTLGKELLDDGVKGGPARLLEIAKNKSEQFENQLQSELTNPALSDAVITKDTLRPYLNDLVSAKSGTPGMKGDLQRIQNIIDDIPEQMTLSEANVMKRRIYNELKSPAYKIDAKLGTKAEALKQIARGLKTEIENEVGGTVVKDINKKLSIYGRLENAMVDQLAREMRNNGVSLTDAILLSGGDTTSWLALLRHVGQGLETYTAQGLKQGQKIGEGIVGKTTKSLLKRAAINAP